jgi:hypothetical protein
MLVRNLFSGRRLLRVSSLITLLLQFPLTDSAQVASPPGHWVSIGPGLIRGPLLDFGQQYNSTGRLMTMAVDPTNPDILYVGSPGADGTEGSGVWKTIDGGNSWTLITANLPSTAVHAIAVDPTNPKSVYIVLFEEGLYRSDDAGVNWIHVSEDALPVRSNLSEDGDRTVLLINPNNPQVLYLTTDLGVQRSTDGGKKWPISLGVGSATSLVIDPQNPNILYAAISNSAGALGVYKTVDGGASGYGSWTAQTQSPLPFGNMPKRNILLAISHPDYATRETVYALFPRGPVFPLDGPRLFGGIGYDLFQTTDGDTWSPQFSCSPDLTNLPDSLNNSYISCNFAVISADPLYPNIVYAGGVAFWYSFDGGGHFNRVPPTNNTFNLQPSTPHVDYWQLVTDPFRENILYAVSDGGIYKSMSHGVDGWEFIGEGITNAEMHDIALSESLPNRAIAGTQDNGSLRYTGGLVWDLVTGGDGGAAAIDPNDSEALYASYNEGSVIRSLDGGDPLSDGTEPTPKFDDFRSGIPDQVWQGCHAYDQTFQLLFHPMERNTLLDACGSLWRTTDTSNPDSTGNWSVIFPAPTGENVVRVAIDPSSNVYYAGTDKGHLFAGPSGENWQQVFAQPDSLKISDIEVDRLHSNTIYVSFAPPVRIERGCNAPNAQRRVYQLSRVDLSSSNPAMTADEITENLKAGWCVNALAIDPHVPRTVYAATTRGVYRGRSNATGGPWVWESYNDGMPLTDVRDLEVDRGQLYAATFGDGALKVTPETILAVRIDIKSGTSENVINIKSKGKTPVAILSSLTFDAPNEVDQTSLTFGRTGNEASFASCETDAQDINGDGLLDLVCGFYTSLTQFQASDTKGFLKGLTVEGVTIAGNDSVKILNP